jgi:hypothetical protein
MYRIDSRGATGDGRFTEGNPTTGTPATVVDASWMNAVQDEIVNVVQAAGLTLAKTDNDQLLEAINLIASMQVRAIYPVGSLYFNAVDNRNPALIFGFGTWVQVQGRFIVGQASADSDFNTGGETGGSKTHNHGGNTGSTTLTIDQIPSHNHSSNAGVTAAGFLTGVVDGNANLSGSVTSGSTGGGQGHTHTIGSASSLPPYYVAFIWRRTA